MFRVCKMYMLTGVFRIFQYMLNFFFVLKLSSQMNIYIYLRRYVKGEKWVIGREVERERERLCCLIYVGFMCKYMLVVLQSGYDESGYVKIYDMILKNEVKRMLVLNLFLVFLNFMDINFRVVYGY